MLGRLGALLKLIAFPKVVYFFKFSIINKLFSYGHARKRTIDILANKRDKKNVTLKFLTNYDDEDSPFSKKPK